MIRQVVTVTCSLLKRRKFRSNNSKNMANGTKCKHCRIKLLKAAQQEPFTAMFKNGSLWKGLLKRHHYNKIYIYKIQMFNFIECNLKTVFKNTGNNDTCKSLHKVIKLSSCKEQLCIQALGLCIQAPRVKGHPTGTAVLWQHLGRGSPP